MKKNNDLFIRPLKKSNTWKDQDALMEEALTKIDYSLWERSIIQRKARGTSPPYVMRIGYNLLFIHSLNALIISTFF